MGKNDNSTYIAKKGRAGHKNVPTKASGPTSLPDRLMSRFWRTYPRIIEGTLIGIAIYNFVQPNLLISGAAGSFYYFSGLRIPIVSDLTDTVKFKKAKKHKK